jgi:hypothetical protein
MGRDDSLALAILRSSGLSVALVAPSWILELRAGRGVHPRNEHGAVLLPPREGSAWLGGGAKPKSCNTVPELAQFTEHDSQ